MAQHVRHKARGATHYFCVWVFWKGIESVIVVVCADLSVNF
jgi:hypothetical protein